MVLEQKLTGRPMDQNRRSSHKSMHPCIYSKLIFEKQPTTHNEEKTASSTNVAGKTGYPHI
jgi:hypothetical protein